MSVHQFVVSVTVDDDGPEYGRAPGDYALAALGQALLPDAGHLDGYGDLPWTATLEVQGGLYASRTVEQQAAISAKISAALTGKRHKDRRQPETRHCGKCGRPYEYLPGKSGERFCSPACSIAAQAQEKKASARAEYELNPRRCAGQCGTAIPYEYRHTRKFCSPACRQAAARG